MLRLFFFVVLYCMLMRSLREQHHGHDAMRFSATHGQEVWVPDTETRSEISETLRTLDRISDKLDRMLDRMDARNELLADALKSVSPDNRFSAISNENRDLSPIESDNSSDVE